MPPPVAPVVAGEVLPESTEIDISDYRKTRAEAPEPATTPAVPEPVKTAAASEPATPEIETEEGSEADKEPKPKGGFQRRIDKLVRENGELERRLAAVEADRKDQKQPTAVAAAKAEGDAKPKEAEFRDYAEFIEALTRWVHRQETKAADARAVEEEKADQETTAKQRTKEKWDGYTNAIPALEEKHPDFRALLSDPKLVLPNYIQTAIIGLKDKGPEVAYQLAKEWKADPDGSTLGKMLAFNEAGDFELAMLELGPFVRSVHPSAAKSPTTPERPASKAPTPITPVSGSGGTIEADTDKMSVAEYRKGRVSGKIR